MDLKELRSKIDNVPPSAALSLWSIVIGWVLLVIYWIQAFNLASTIGQYFSVSKLERDSAHAGASLLQTLQSIQATSTILEPLKFVGLSFIIFGIGLVLYAILKTLRLRAQAVMLALKR